LATATLFVVVTAILFVKVTTILFVMLTAILFEVFFKTRYCFNTNCVYGW
jgi:hypothetical protein